MRLHHPSTTLSLTPNPRTDLAYATVFGKDLHFPSAYCAFELDSMPLTIPLASTGAMTAGLGFSRLARDPLFSELMASICDIRRLCVLFFLAKANKRSAISVSAFWNRCNLIDERLTSLSLQDPSDDPQEKILRSCAVATQLFVAVVLREDPPACASTETLSISLYTSLLQSDLELAWGIHAELLLWVLFTGYMGCPAGPLRDWYVQQCKRVMDTLGRREKLVVRNCLAGFLWIEMISFPYCSALWAQIQGAELDLNVVRINVVEPPLWPLTALGL